MGKNIYKIFLLYFLFIFADISGQKAAANYSIEGTPGELKINVNLWGYVNLPGRYEVPISTNLLQLLTFAGGPKTHATMDDIVIYRVNENEKMIELEIDLEDPEDSVPADLKLFDEDTIVIDYSAGVGWRDFFSLIAAPLALLATIAIALDRLSK
ncbi:MAG: hypothetical protein HND52_18970 [Ignavibacteriae bacterium]|nr:hypothetical protein [Ignavibacteriota bacterium]